MAKKKLSLVESLQGVGKPEPKATAQPLEEKPKSPRTPSREGKKFIGGHFDPVVSKQLKGIALANDSSIQALLAEAINDLFEKYGKPPIA